MSSAQGSFLNNLASAVRENPLAATLIGAGALWLLTGSEKIKSAANSVLRFPRWSISALKMCGRLLQGSNGGLPHHRSRRRWRAMHRSTLVKGCARP